MKGLNIGEGKFHITLQIHETGGKGLCVFITGGEQSHVGGIALAVPRHKTSGDGLTSDVSTLCVPGHKDVLLASQVASHLAIAVDETVSATAGVHIEKATREEIDLISKNAIEVVDRWVSEYTSRKDARES